MPPKSLSEQQAKQTRTEKPAAIPPRVPRRIRGRQTSQDGLEPGRWTRRRQACVIEFWIGAAVGAVGVLGGAETFAYRALPPGAATGSCMRISRHHAEQLQSQQMRSASGGGT